MGRNTQSSREYVKSMEEEILSMRTYMKMEDIETLVLIGYISGTIDQGK